MVQPEYKMAPEVHINNLFRLQDLFDYVRVTFTDPSVSGSMYLRIRDDT